VPLYEYECEACHHRFERIQQYSDPIVRKCPKCGKKKVKKLLSSPAIQFKGSGFYITDYKRAGEKKEPTEAKEAKPESKSESKSEPKPESKPKKDSPDK